MSPLDRLHGHSHRREVNTPPALLLPGFHTITKASVGMCDRMRPKPIEVDHTRAVSSYRVANNISRFSLTT